MRILVVEDDRSSARSIELLLKTQGYVCDNAECGEDGIEIGKLYDYDLIILDLMLPDMDGYEVLRRLRDARVQTPILILSGLIKPQSKVKGLNLGADDYLTKPYENSELIARIQSVVRRSKGYPDSIIRIGEVSVNLDSKTVKVAGQPLNLTPKEYAVLELLSLRKGRVLTKDTILNHLYGGVDEPGYLLVFVYICKLRQKIKLATGGKSYIETSFGQGYVMRVPEAPAKMEIHVPIKQTAA